ncbi:hypothetical protein Taro_053501 [Colocasia esculenta]|uniref:Uncharacterized protein n=1 Tax=Colocasia esculenta TaxID=4460 RepID=A0A843XMZ3_COLES|nr:hypothetical protein [Colocasia esculenta]
MPVEIGALSGPGEEHPNVFINRGSSDEEPEESDGVSARCVELSGPASWARSVRWFTECERDGGEGYVLDASVVGVAFRLPLFGVNVCMRAACCARNGAADVRSGKASPEAVAIRSRQHVNVLGVCPGTGVYCRGLVVFLDTLTLVLSIGPFVRDCETERLFLCCVVRCVLVVVLRFEVCHGVGTVVVVVVMRNQRSRMGQGKSDEHPSYE